jgi:UDP-N-acetylmuramoyl-tripeptide--D-alanyl-D-alanine ligase
MAETVPLWTWEALVAAAHGTAEGAPAGPITGFSIDTRSIAAGDVFVALTDQRDGHDFVAAAFANWAAAALVRHDFAAPAGCGPLVRVDDPLRALGRIAVAARARLRPGARVIAVTGSADFAVIEIGMNHAEEIRPLTRMARPHIAVITNVLPVHVGNFADGEEGVAHAKAEIFDGLEPGGLAILPRDNRHSALLMKAASARGARIVTFGTTADAFVGARDIKLGDTGSEIVAEIAFRPLRYRLGTVGVHIAVNSLAVVAVLDTLQLPLDSATKPLAAITPPVGRGARTVLNAGERPILLIDESYNANPASMRAAIAVLGAVSRAAYPRRVAILGDMLELGDGSEQYHVGLADPINAAAVDVVLCCGPHMRKLFDALPASRQGTWAPDSTALIPPVVDALQPGDAVMVKGSLGSRMAPIVAAIKAKYSAG